MGRLIEATHVSLGGEIGDIAWAFPYLDAEHQQYSWELLESAEALLLGRKTYQGLSAAYPAMEATAEGVFGEFVHRMNTIPKYVATTTLTEFSWNASKLGADVVEAVRALKAEGDLVKFGTGPLDALLLEHRLVDEYHFWLAPVVAPATVQPLFEGVTGAPSLTLADVTRFASGVVALRYTAP
ncbi:dihydrofolate reductase family protein [Flexivirga caeni]|uniref:Bacterial bifunctional deaminase-reductase C-terminal domain-containing protein n=1 Tax=Flexivirga caeni TaxID=2294115 RepID=A0A3M9LXC0_9MICO|nr:dihydrofolate reductase family protein [Flexivirga caeni]RNI17959.1 hypothetical protein EFY87_18820 [Flexivirga caeni]